MGPLAPEERGHLFEGCVATLLRFARDTHKAFDDMWYWSPAEATKTELDFLLRHEDAFVAIEVKSASHVDTRFLEGLRAIAPLAGLKHRLVVYAGDVERITEDGIRLMPFLQFAERLCAGELFGDCEQLSRTVAEN